MLAATLSPSYGIYSGFERCENVPLTEGSEEYLDSEKYEIKKRSARRAAAAADRPPQRGAGAPTRRSSGIDNLTFLETENEHLIAYIKRTGDNAVIACVNLDPAARTRASSRFRPSSGCRPPSTSPTCSATRLHVARRPQLRAPRAGPAAGSPAARRAVTGDAALAALVGAQRWFGSKSRSLAGGRMVDCGALARAAPWRSSRPSSPTAAASCTSCRIACADDGAIELGRPTRARARAARGAAALGTPLDRRRPRRVRARRHRCPPSAALEPVRAIGGEQSNSSVVFGERCILKAYRRLEGGESPELELLRFLDAHGFGHAPPPARLVPLRRRRDHGHARHRAGVRSWCARRLAATRWTRSPTPRRSSRALRRLGEVTARMHAVLASARRRPAFRPEERRASAARGRRRAGAARRRRREPVRARRDELLERLRALHRARLRWQGDPPARRLPPRAGAVGARGLARARLRGRARPPPRRAPRARARRCATSRACCARSPTPPRPAASRGRRYRPAGSATRARPSWPATRRRSTSRCCPPPASRATALLAACELEKALYELRYELTTAPTGCTSRSRASCACSTATSALDG